MIPWNCKAKGGKARGTLHQHTFCLHLKLNSTWNYKPNKQQASHNQLFQFQKVSWSCMTFKRKYLWIVCGFLEKCLLNLSFWIYSHCLLIITTVQPFNKALRRAPFIHLEFSELNGSFVMLCSNSPQELLRHFQNIPWSKLQSPESWDSLLISLFYRSSKTTALLRLRDSLLFHFIIKSGCHMSPLYGFLSPMSITSYVFWSFLLAKINWLK